MPTFKGVRSLSNMLVVPATVAAHPKGAALPGAPKDGCRIVMMIDTGARFSLVTEPVLAQLGVAPIGTTHVRTSLQDIVERPVYRIAVGLEFEDVYGESHVAKIPLSVIASPPVTATLSRDTALHHDGLLGLDFLSHFTLVYEGRAGEFRLSWE